MVWQASQLKLTSPRFCILFSQRLPCAAMAASGDDRILERDEASDASPELAEASTEDVGREATSAASGLAGGTSAVSGESPRVAEGNRGGPDGAARPSEAAAAPSAAASSGTAAGIIAAAPATPTMKTRIAALREEQRKLRATSKAKTREIRNAERRAKRLKDKVGTLTDEDLVEVLRSRAEAKAASPQAAGGTTEAPSGQESRSPPLKRYLVTDMD